MADALVKAIRELGHPAGRLYGHHELANERLALPPGNIITWGRAVNKYAQGRAIMRAGVPCIEVTENPPEGADGRGWLHRSFNHEQGQDFGSRSIVGGYYARRYDFVHEIRCHVYAGKVIRTGEKRARPRFPNPSSWNRSYDAGWDIYYDGVHSTPEQRRVAVAAVKAVGLPFGAVDIGLLADGSPLTIEVNSAPGFDAYRTAQAYAAAIVAEVSNAR